MYRTPVSNTLDLFEVEDAQVLHQSHCNSRQNHLNSYYLNKSEEEEEIGSTRQELSEKLPETRDMHFQEPCVQQGEGGMEEDRMDFMGNKRSRDKWQDRFEFSHIHLSYHEMGAKNYAYEIQFSRPLGGSHEANQNQQITGKKQVLASQINRSRLEERRVRVNRYLQKKARRCFIKKISYECRKTVADQRLRVKGRFVNKKLAKEIMKSKDPDGQAKSRGQHWQQQPELCNQQT